MTTPTAPRKPSGSQYQVLRLPTPVFLPTAQLPHCALNNIHTLTLWDTASTQPGVIQPLWLISLNLLAAIYSLEQLTVLPTIGGEHLVGYSALNLPTLLPDGTWAKPDSDLLYAEPYFFPRNFLVEFTPNIYIAANPLQLSLFSVPMQPHTSEPHI